MKYADHVKTIADMKGRWVYYDKFFRINKERTDPWQDVNWELWNKAFIRPQYPQSRARSRNRQDNSTVARGSRREAALLEELPRWGLLQIPHQ